MVVVVVVVVAVVVVVVVVTADLSRAVERTSVVPNSASGERGEAPSRGRVRSLPGVAENRTLKTAATPELHLASRGLAVAPRPPHTAAL